MSALVVGGTRGIGRAIARMLAERGHQVVAVGRRPPERPIPTVEYVRADLENTRSRKRLLTQLATRRFNCVVFVQRYRGAGDSEGDSWNGELAVTLTATRDLVEGLSPKMPRGAALVVVGSLAHRFVASEQPVAYHAAKAGLRQLVRYYATTLGPRGIRMNSISPGLIVKEEAAEFYARNVAMRKTYESVTPLGRLGAADDVANAVLFLAGPNASFITGQDLEIDGGVSLMSHESIARIAAAFQ